MDSALSKGPLLEEALRAYFLAAGYYVIRGVPFVYEGFDVTDIDAWLYGRASSVSREIAIVDIKSKRTPQAIERIFWTAGLQKAVGADRAIVATTDKRPEVKDFGRQSDVLVLDGLFLQKLQSKERILSSRLSDEEFGALVGGDSLSKLDGNWKARLRSSKALLAKGPSFDTCIEWLAQAKFFAEQAVTRSSRRENALRALYLVCSYIAIAVDYELRDISFQETSERAQLIAEGLTYGAKGRSGMKRLIDLSTGLVAEYANNGRAIAGQVKTKIEHSLEDIPTSMLGEYFARRDVLGSLFNIARELEALAMNRVFSSHGSASIETRSLLGCLSDYWGIDRAHLALGQGTSSVPNQSPLQPVDDSDVAR